MATRYAVNTGNWSALSTWDGGASLPGVNDDVYADGKTVTIDQDVSVTTLRNGTRSGGTSGGGFTCSTTRTITTSAGIIGQTSATNNAATLTFTGGAGTTLTINSTIYGHTANSGQPAVYHNGAGALVINGTIYGGSSSATGQNGVTVAAGAGAVTVTGNIFGGQTNLVNAAFNHGLVHNSTSTLTIIGNVSGGYIRNVNAGILAGVWVAGVCIVNITGNVSGGNLDPSGQTTHSTVGLYITAAATVNITGNVSGGSGTQTAYQYGHPGIFATAAGGTVTINGTVTGTDYGSGVLSMTGGGHGPLVQMSGPFVCSTNGWAPFACHRWQLTDVTDNALPIRGSSNNSLSLVTADALPSVPNASDVRLGVSFGSGLTGTCAVPVAADVAHGIAVDNTTGTAALKLTDVAALVGAQIAGALST